MTGKQRKEAHAAGHRPSNAAPYFELAVRHHQAGQLREAEQLYRQALAADPKHADSLNLLGVLAHQVGRHDGAVELIGRALSINGHVAEFHYNIGLAYGALGQFAEAAAHNAKATALRADYAEAHLNLGNALFALGKPDEAIACYRHVIRLQPASHVALYNFANALAELRRADEAEAVYLRVLALKPDYAEAHNNLGTLLTAQGKIVEAIDRHRRAVALQPGLVAAHVNLANAYRSQGRFDDAIACYRAALAHDPRHAEVHLNLGVALMTRGQLREAAGSFERALALKPDLTFAALNLARVSSALGDLPGALADAKRLHDVADTSETRALFYDCFRDPRAFPFAAPYRAELTQAIAKPWGNPRAMAPLAAHLIAADLDLANRAATGTLIAAAKDDALLLALLVSAPAGDAALEGFLTAARAVFLHEAAAGSPDDEAMLPFACALARQCFLNDYVYLVLADERRTFGALLTRTADALRSGAAVSARAVAALASYVALHEIEGAEQLLERTWPAPIRPLLTQQVAEPHDLARIKAAIPRLTPINDDISQAVRAQYEENPYPRWTALAQPFRRCGLDAFMRERYPLSPFRPLGRSAIDYLVAGCGTGQQVADVVEAFDDVAVTAVDVSLASLGYAKAKIDALGVRAVEFGQADILELASLGRTFDVVDSTGVLHHMRDPLQGWRVLASLLRPNGLMHIALYSTIARRGISAAQRFIVTHGFARTDDGIRQGRAALLALPDDAPEKAATKLWDFGTLSECRDLLFHAQEHTFDVTEIATFLSENAFDFLGFQLAAGVPQAYAARFPDDPARTDLANWHTFEQDNPATFLGMYQFWMQKRPA